MGLLKEVGLMKIFYELRPCYTKLVKQFVANLYANMENKERVGGRCVKLYPKVIDAYLGISKSSPSEDIPSLN